MLICIFNVTEKVSVSVDFNMINWISTVCDRIENSDRTGTGPDCGLGSFWPEPDRITSQKKLTGFDRIGRIFTDFLKL